MKRPNNAQMYQGRRRARRHEKNGSPSLYRFIRDSFVMRSRPPGGGPL